MNEARYDKMKQILMQLEDGVSGVFTSENYIRLLDFMGKFHNYSYNNCLLILSQCPHASKVASFQSWKRLGYPVKKGERGIKVLVPIPYTYEKERTIQDPKGTIVETLEMKGLSFRIGNVFDVSQVSGEIPTLAKELQDNPEDLKKAVNQIISNNDNIKYDSKLSKEKANGYYQPATKEIYLRAKMSALQTFKTLIHEKAHSLLHNSDPEKYTRSEAEVQAESIAYCVCSAFGQDTSAFSFGYIAGWSNGRELKELKSSLAIIEKTARELMNWIADSSELTLAE